MGTSLNDTFNASVGAVGNVVTNTLQNFDSLDGAGGTDKLNVNLQSTGAGLVVSPVALNNIEQINVAASGTNALELSLLNAGQAQQVSNVGSTVGLTLSGLAASATALDVQNTAQATTFTYLNTTGAQTSSLNVGNVTGAAAITVNGIETVNLTSSGNTAAANSITLNDNALTTLNIAGANALTLAGLGATTTNVNGAAMTGGLTTALAYAGAAIATAGSLTGGAGNDSLTGTAGSDIITGNAGNDTLVAAAGVDSITAGDGVDLIVFAADGDLTAADTAVGGVGVDTLRTTSANATGVTSTAISGIETVQVTDALGANLTLSNLQAGISGVILDSTAIGRTITFDSGVAGNVTLNAAVGGALTVASAGTGITDSLTINNGSAATNVFAGNALNATGVETLTLNLATPAGTAQIVGAIGGISGTTVVTINGNNQVTTGAITGGSVNASGLTGTGGLILGAATVCVKSITGSANADTIRGSSTATTI